jgi:predicted dinucleotide-utilizing enzyme
LLDRLPGSPPGLSCEELADASDPIVEAATQAALVAWAPSILDAGRDLVVLSAGALLEHPEWIASMDRARSGAKARGSAPRQGDPGS